MEALGNSLQNKGAGFTDVLSVLMDLVDLLTRIFGLLSSILNFQGSN